MLPTCLWTVDRPRTRLRQLISANSHPHRHKTYVEQLSSSVTNTTFPRKTLAISYNAVLPLVLSILKVIPATACCSTETYSSEIPSEKLSAYCPRFPPTSNLRSQSLEKSL